MSIRVHSCAFVAILALGLAAPAQPTVEIARVQAGQGERTIKLPGEFAPYESVDLRARVQGYVQRVLVDRGSAVRKGQLLIVLDAPEMRAQLAESESRTQVAAAQRAEAEARLAGAQATYARLKEAAQTPGAISANELEQAERSVDAGKAAVQASAAAVKAAEAAVRAIRDLEAYLNVTAPFSGTVTERYVHPGALASPTAGPLLKIEDTSRLRLVVAVPEADAGGIVPRARVKFTVPAFPQRVFRGTVARISRALDPKTRTMAVELDTPNPGGLLAPGMYPEVSWPVRRRGAMLVPATAVVTTTERTFVIRANDGVAEWVNVRKGPAAGDQVEVYGDLNEGDPIVKRASDEIRQGTRLKIKAAS